MPDRAEAAKRTWQATRSAPRKHTAIRGGRSQHEAATPPEPVTTEPATAITIASTSVAALRPNVSASR